MPKQAAASKEHLPTPQGAPAPKKPKTAGSEEAPASKEPLPTPQEAPAAKEATGSEAAKEATATGAKPVPLPRIPVLPADGCASSAATPARSILSGVIPWVQVNLREYMKSHKELFNKSEDSPLFEHQPLAIKSSLSKDALKSYKAPWNSNSAADSLATTDMYEAAGNLCWVRPFPLSKEMEIVSGDTLLWEQIAGLAEQFFSASAYVNCNCSSGVPQILFPITMFVNAPREISMRSTAYFQGSLELISGHAYLYAWWYAMFKALRDDAATLVASLWQCGLTATLHLRQGLDIKQMAAISCAQSELRKAAKSNVTDTFPAFALKALLIAPGGEDTGRTNILKDLGVTYNGAPVSKVLAACSVDRYSGCVVCVCSRVPQRHDSDLPIHHSTSKDLSTEQGAHCR